MAFIHIHMHICRSGDVCLFVFIYVYILHAHARTHTQSIKQTNTLRNLLFLRRSAYEERYVHVIHHRLCLSEERVHTLVSLGALLWQQVLDAYASSGTVLGVEGNAKLGGNRRLYWVSWASVSVVGSRDN